MQGVPSAVHGDQTSEFAEFIASSYLPNPNDSWRLLADPSQFLSFETVGRQSPKTMRNKVPSRNIGVGNVRMYNPQLYYTTLLIEAKLDEARWSPKTGAPRFQHTMTLRLHTARFQICYGDTTSEHKCVWTMPPHVEDNMKLLEVPVDRIVGQ